MNCPKCSADMGTVIYKGFKVLRCKQCQGLWFKPADLAELRRDDWMADYMLDPGSARLGRKYDRLPHVACPECATEMKREADKKQPHIVYEVCPQGHGTFLDAGEFKDLVHETIWDKFKPAR